MRRFRGKEMPPSGGGFRGWDDAVRDTGIEPARSRSIRPRGHRSIPHGRDAADDRIWCAILGSNQHGREAFDREVTVRARTGEMPPMIEYGARYWERTSDLFRVREARYRCANRAYVRLFSLPSEVATGFEPVWTALQAAASPLGHATRCAVTALGSYSGP